MISDSKLSKILTATLTVLFLSSLSAAAVTDIAGSSAGDVEIGDADTGVSQEAVFNVTIDGSSNYENVTLDVSDATTDVSISGTSDVALNSTSTVNVSEVYDETASNGIINITLGDDSGTVKHSVEVTATLTHDKSTVNSEKSNVKYNITNSDDSVYDSANFDIKDTVNPEFSNPSPASGSTLSDNSTEFSVTLEDSGTGIEPDSISVTASDSQEEVFTKAGTGSDRVNYSSSNLEIGGAEYTDGQVTIYVNASDSAGNMDTDYSSSFTVDTTPPEITNPEVVVTEDHNSNGILNPGDRFKVSGTVTDATSVSSVKANLQSLSVSESKDLTSESGSDIYSKTFTVADDGSTDGEITFQVTAEDGQTNSDSVDVNGSVSVDNNLPTVSAGSASTKADGEIDVEFSSSTESTEVDSFNIYRKSGGGYSSVGTKSSAGTFTDAETTHNTQYTYRVEVVDDAGNKVNSSTVSATADSEAPTVTYTGNDYETTDSPTSVTFDLAETVNSVSQSSIEVTLNDSDTEDGKELDAATAGNNDYLTYSSNTLTIDLTRGTSDINLAEGDVNISVTVADSSGNTEVENFESVFTVDTIPPTIESAAYRDSNRDGLIDRIDVNYNEPIDYSPSNVPEEWNLLAGEIGAIFTLDSRLANEKEDEITLKLVRSTEIPEEFQGLSLTGHPSLEIEYTGTSELEDRAGNNAKNGQTSVDDEADPVIDFSDGTNLISFPSKVGSYSLDELIKDSEKIDSIWRYRKGEWESYKPGKQENDFTHVTGGSGYVLKATRGGKIVADIDQEKEAFKPSGVSLDKSRWNLVGHYKETPMPLLQDPTIGDETAKQVVSLDPFKQVVFLNPGDGYWVQTRKDTLYAPEAEEPEVPV